MSGKSKDRPELTKLFEKLRKGDTVVVWKLDRLGRSLKDLIDLITKMQQL
ncbi:recombinase family protein, partial [Brucella sp. 21LCYQ03]|nr:recombinase family protein [Brucella sp. 21LCYQ03]